MDKCNVFLGWQAQNQEIKMIPCHFITSHDILQVLKAPALDITQRCLLSFSCPLGHSAGVSAAANDLL